MPAAPEPRVFKQNRLRTVRLDPGGGANGEPVVVKAFHHPRPWWRWKDRARSRHERRLLEHLRGLGVRVPEPLDLRRVGKTWELVLQWIPEAPTLFEITLEGRPWPVPSHRVAAPLGVLLAGLHRGGIDHPDMHSGNVLIDARGLPWMIDFHQAHRRASLTPAMLVRDLVTLGAAAREFHGPAFRSRFLIAWHAALPDELRAGLPARSELARRVERESRTERRAWQEARSLRWLRGSGVCRRVAEGDLAAFERKALPEGWTRAAQAWIEREGAGDQRGRTVPGELAGDGARGAIVVVEERGAADLRRLWRACARLQAHGVAALRPLSLVESPQPRCLLAAPAPGRPLDQALVDANAARRRRLARELGALFGRLADRGLAVKNLSATTLRVTDDGRPFLGAIEDLRALPADELGRAWWGAPPEGFHALPGERARFVAAFVRELRGGATERREVARRLRDG